MNKRIASAIAGLALVGGLAASASATPYSNSCATGADGRPERSADTRVENYPANPGPSSSSGWIQVRGANGYLRAQGSSAPMGGSVHGRGEQGSDYVEGRIGNTGGKSSICVKTSKTDRTEVTIPA